MCVEVIKPCTVLIVDDHRLIRQGLRSLLSNNEDLVVVGEAAEGTEALASALEHRPDVILLKLAMPARDGLRVIAKLKRAVPDAKIIALTEDASDSDLVYGALRNGAIGYLSRNDSAEELISAVRMVARGQPVIAGCALVTLVASLNQGMDAESVAAQPQRAHAPENVLSVREREVLDLVAQGLSNRKIGANLCIAESTVRSHVHNILTKLNLINRIQAAAYASASNASDR